MRKIFHTVRKKFHPFKTRARLIKDSWRWQTADIVFIATMLFATLSLLALLWFNLRPIQTVDIKVPVATDQASYFPGEQIGGIFFGEVYYEGEVRVLREVYCKDYKNIIAPPENAKNGDFYDTQSIPRKLEGLSVTVGNLPTDIPIGKNCVLQFTNVYEIHTPFGTRRIEYRYYTQNFSIVSKERRELLECEATGRKDCAEFHSTEPQPSQQIQQSPESPNAQTPEDTDNLAPTSRDSQDFEPTETKPETPRNEPVIPEQNCAINFLGIKLFCD